MMDAAPSQAVDPKELAAHWRSMTPTRMYDYGVLPDDIERMQHATSQGIAWDTAAETLADEQEARAERALASGHTVTAIEAYRAAVANLIFAQMAFNFDTPRKKALYERLSGILSRISKIAGSQLERLELEFEDSSVVGWLIRPELERARGTVIVFGGQSGWGPAYWRHADAFAKRGLATILAEGPGQGETRIHNGVYLDADVPSAFSRFVDYALEDGTLGGSVGIFGNSLGGLYAALTAAADTRLVACCINGAPARPQLLGHRSFDEQAAAMLGSKDLMRVSANLERLAFDPAEHSLKCAVLVLHGGNDVLFDLSAQQPFLEAAGQDQELRVWPDGDHTIYNHCEERTAFVADWFVDKLS